VEHMRKEGEERSRGITAPAAGPSLFMDSHALVHNGVHTAQRERVYRQSNQLRLNNMLYFTKKTSQIR